jgi:hypothetical protein
LTGLGPLGIEIWRSLVSELGQSRLFKISGLSKSKFSIFDDFSPMATAVAISLAYRLMISTACNLSL